jgi:SAM-dependent methyltransferase
LHEKNTRDIVMTDAAAKSDRHDLIPPETLLFDGTATVEQFKQIGEGFTREYLINRARLLPQDRVLDVGCGVGQKARVLVSYLNSHGSYDGLDIVPEGVEWCREAYKQFSNFRFCLADIYNSHYNKTGPLRDHEYRFPFDPEEFDLVFLSSVFTHMLSEGVENYVSEIARVLKPGGRCVATFFLLNAETGRREAAGAANMDFPHDFGLCRVQDRDNPTMAVAHRESWARETFDRCGLRIAEMTYGFWSGGRDMLNALQDTVLAVRS